MASAGCPRIRGAARTWNQSIAGTNTQSRHHYDTIKTQSREQDGPPVARVLLGERCQRNNVHMLGETLSQCHLSVCSHKLSAVASIPSRLVHGVVAISLLHESDTVAMSTCQNRKLESNMLHKTDAPVRSGRTCCFINIHCRSTWARSAWYLTPNRATC